MPMRARGTIAAIPETDESVSRWHAPAIARSGRGRQRSVGDRSLGVVLVATSVVGTVLRGVTMTALALLALGEVAAPVVDGRVAGLLALGEVSPMLLLGSLAGFLLADGEPAVLVLGMVVIGVVVIGMIMTFVVMVVAVVVVGMIAQCPGLPAISDRAIVTPRSTPGRPSSARLSASHDKADGEDHGADDDRHRDAHVERERHVRPLKAEGEEPGSKRDERVPDPEAARRRCPFGRGAPGAAGRIPLGPLAGCRRQGDAPLHAFHLALVLAPLLA